MQFADQLAVTLVQVVPRIVEPARRRIEEYAAHAVFLYDTAHLLQQMLPENGFAGIEKHLIIFTGAIRIPIRAVDQREVAARAAAERRPFVIGIHLNIRAVHAEHRHELHTELVRRLDQPPETRIPTPSGPVAPANR